MSVAEWTQGHSLSSKGLGFRLRKVILCRVCCCVLPGSLPTSIFSSSTRFWEAPVLWEVLRMWRFAFQKYRNKYIALLSNNFSCAYQQPGFGAAVGVGGLPAPLSCVFSFPFHSRSEWKASTMLAWATLPTRRMHRAMLPGTSSTSWCGWMKWRRRKFLLLG